MKGKFTLNEYSTIDSGEAAFLIFKGFDYKLDASTPTQVKIVFPGGETGSQLTLVKKIKDDWWIQEDYRRFLRVYQDLIRSIKAIQSNKR